MLIEQYLLYLAAPPHRVGFDQLACTLRFLLQHPHATQLHSEIYPAVADSFHTTVSCIDHNLRTVIEHIWQYGDPERLQSLGCCGGKYRPSNKMFLFAVAKRLQLFETSPELCPKEIVTFSRIPSPTVSATDGHGQAAAHPL